MNKKLKNIIIIIVTSSIMGISYNLLSQNGIPLVRVEQKLEAAEDGELLNTSESIEEGTIKSISLAQAYQLYTTNAIFIDARDNWDFADGHIARALNIPEFSFEPSDPKLKTIDKNLLYVIYCGSDDCDLSKRLANEFAKIGFTNLYVFLDGYEFWLKNNYPVEVPEND